MVLRAITGRGKDFWRTDMMILVNEYIGYWVCVVLVEVVLYRVLKPKMIAVSIKFKLLKNNSNESYCVASNRF